jgi:hypothetical protein
MNVQPKLSSPDDCAAPFHAEDTEVAETLVPRFPRVPREARMVAVPRGLHGFLTWPVEFEVEPWRP